MPGRNGAIALALMALTAAGCGGKKDEKVELKGTVTLGVLAPTGRPGELGARAKDLADGARMAVEETNASGGVLGRKLDLSFVDDGCDPVIAYEAAKAFVSDAPVAGVIGGMCDETAARATPVLESSSAAVPDHIGDGQRHRQPGVDLGLHAQRHHLPAGPVGHVLDELPRGGAARGPAGRDARVEGSRPQGDRRG